MSLLGDNIIDSRDVIKRLEELKSEFDSYIEELTEWGEDSSVTEVEFNDLNAWMLENAEEYKTLQQLNEDGENYASDWIHGATLILDEHFVTYAEQLASDIGMVDDENSMSQYIDWEKFANDLKADYTEIDAACYEYWVLS